MDDLLLRAWWLLLMAAIAFVAVGCGAHPAQTIQVTETPVAASAPAPERDIAPTAVPTVERAPAPLLALNPQPAPQSGQVRVTGTGFAAGEPVSITASTGADAHSEPLPLGGATATADGTIDSTIPALPDALQSGPHVLEAVGQTSQRHGAATLWIRAPQPWLVLDSYDVPQYGDLGLIAGGFEPMDQVLVSLEPAAGGSGVPVQLVTLTTDQAGNAAWAQLKLPRLAAGAYTMVLHGQANAAELQRDVHVTPLKPIIELSPWAGPPGVPVQLNARGFAPNERIHASLGGTADPTAMQADEYGNLWGAGPVHIPQTAAPGTLALNLVGDESGATSSADFKVLEPKPWLELSTWSGAPGAPVGFGGGGWIGGEHVSIHLGSATNPTQATGAADDNGWLKDVPQVYVPNDVDDEIIFAAVGEQSHLVAAATFKVVFPFGLRPGRSSAPQVPVVKSGG